MTRWFVLQLSEVGEKLSDLQLLRSDLESRGAVDVFIPAYSGRDDKLVEITYLYEGYVFARTSDPCCLVQSPYVSSALGTEYQNGFVPSFVSDRQIELIREQLRSIVPCHDLGTRVRAVKGLYKGMSGTIVRPESGTHRELIEAELTGSEELSVEQISSFTGIDVHDVRSHLRSLVSAGAVTCSDDGGHCRWTGDPPVSVTVLFDLRTFPLRRKVSLLFLRPEEEVQKAEEEA